MDWHSQTIEQVMEAWQTSEQGLTGQLAVQRLEQYGPNELQASRRKGPLAMLLGQFKDVMIIILVVAALISGLLGDLTDTVVIFVIIVLNAVMGFIQEYRAEKAMEALKQMAVSHAKVIRGGNVHEVPASELVPGDLVQLDAGDAVPADLRLSKVFNLQIEEAALTGESIPTNKATTPLDGTGLPLGERLNMAYKGTYVTHGRGEGIVVATGMSTELGKIASMLQGEQPPTPLQERMQHFAGRLSVLVLLLCVVFFVAGWLRGEPVLTLLLTAISLAVAAIPEALPAVITISLALAARNMIRLNSLIRKLPAVETLGSVTYICTDKTGTLTRNKMHIEELVTRSGRFERAAFSELRESEEDRLLLQAFALNHDVVRDGDRLLGDSTEVALVELVGELQVDAPDWPRVAEQAFDADRKLMTTVHARIEGFVSFTKGAPDVLLERCADISHGDIQAEVERMAAKGMRVLGFAMRSWERMPQEEEWETNLRFIGLAGLIDPPREEVAEAVAQCHTAGIIPVMITGDHPLTARQIASQIGILRPEADLTAEGWELEEMDEAELAEKVEKIRVYARVSPEQKLTIVKALQARGHYVAMTGDGVNDAPSLKRANIGIAMGITGTDVSKQAADIILLDDNFSTIIRAVREGRRIYDNILKFIKYLMTTNAGELWTLLLGPMLGLPVALLPIHILWINLISDGLPAISLSFEKEEKNIMRRPPRPPGETVFAEGRGWHILWIGLLMAAVSLGAQQWAIANGLPWQTIVFNVLCLTQMGHVLAIRSHRRSLFRIGLLSNKRLLGAVLLSIALQMLVTYMPVLQPIFRTESLSAAQLAIIFALSSIVFFAVELEKAFSRRFRP